MKIPFYKYQGTGNDFIMIDNRLGILQGDENEWIGQQCKRHFGVGADGLILLNGHTDYDFEMDYFNADGNRSTLCGNGARCTVQFAIDLGVIANEATFQAIDGLHYAKKTSRGIALEMQQPEGFRQLSPKAYFIDTGSPHYVEFVEEGLTSFDLHKIGAAIRYSEPWAEEGVNVNFVRKISSRKIQIRTYERGVEAETLSCGTGVTAAALAAMAHFEGMEKEIEAVTRGGSLWINAAGSTPVLEGAAAFVYKGELNL